jgi:hypothetical protein
MRDRDVGCALGIEWTNTFLPPPKSEGHTDVVRVAGTDAWTTNSVMAACIPANPSGTFMGDDEEAIEAVY